MDTLQLPKSEVASPVRLDELRIRRGIALRQALMFDRQLNDRWSASSAQIESVAEALSFRASPKGGTTPEYADARWLFIAAALSVPSASHQVRLLRSISHPDDVAFNTNYTVGSALSPISIRPDDISITSDIDYSIIAESWIRSQPVKSTDIERYDILFVEFVRSVLAQSNLKGTIEPDALNDLTQRMSVIKDPYRLENLSDIRRFSYEAKRDLLHLIGPDLLSSISILCDPTSSPSHTQLEALLTTFKAWNLDRLFGILLVIRLSNPSEDIRHFCKSHLLELFSAEEIQTQLDMVRSLLNGDSTARSVITRSKEYGRLTVSLIYRFQCALNSRNARAIVDSIVDIYDFDYALVDFLDWTTIYNILDDAPFVTAKSTFVTMLMTQPSITSMHPDVGFGIGKGGFVADLTSLLGDRRRAITTLLPQLKTLPAAPAAALTRALLERPIIERLSSSGPTPKGWSSEHPPIDTTRVSITRIDALRLAVDRGLLNASEVEPKVDEEIDRLRMQYFQSQLRVGRVKIQWEEVSREIAIIIMTDFPHLGHGKRTLISASSDIRLRISRFLTEHVCDHILYESRVSIDQALSNNLRHGIIVPRIQRAFDDAFHTVYSRASLPTWDDGVAHDIFGPWGSTIASLRDDISSEMKRFVDGHLTLTNGGIFDVEVRSALLSAIERYLATDSRVPLHRLIRDITTKRLKRYLETCSRHLREIILSRLTDSVRATRTAIGALGDNGVRSFIDSLETNIDAAAKEASEWIGLADSRPLNMPFVVKEVVQLELISSHLYGSSKLKVKIRTFVKNKGIFQEQQFTVHGKYLEFFQEIVHNLISNAFNGSGERLKTEIELDIIFESDGIRIRCANSISDSRVAEVIRRHSATVALAGAKLGSQARRDSVSGFQKIRLAFDRALSVQPTFNIPPISARNRRFVIEIHAKFDAWMGAS